ncbi:uncharacterized protein HPF18_0916 [Helicobacter pylori]|nr:uncharacterized protein HPF18_0916 [Helicobacter pylori]
MFAQIEHFGLRASVSEHALREASVCERVERLAITASHWSRLFVAVNRARLIDKLLGVCDHLLDSADFFCKIAQLPSSRVHLWATTFISYTKKRACRVDGVNKRARLR